MAVTAITAVLVLVAAVLILRSNRRDDDRDVSAIAASPTATPTPEMASPTPSAAPSPSPTPAPTRAPSTPTPRPTPTPAPTPKTTVTVLIVNEFQNAVHVTLNDVTRNDVKPGQQITVEVVPASDNHDSISVRDTGHSGCGMGDADNYFDLGNSYRARVYNAGDNCIGGESRYPAPGLSITRA
jgi:hypothetical protein